MHQIGIGVLGPVFRTYEPDRDRLVAVKVFRLDITPEQAKALAGRLQAVADAGLSHASIVLPLGGGVQGTVAYLAEEYVAAESLDVAMRHYAPATFEKVCPFIAQLGGALDEAHRQGISHGGLHLRDVFITPDVARMNGFGVAAALESLGVRPPVRRPYSAPERIAGQPWGAAADVFSLAAISYELLTGRRVTGPGEQTATAARDEHPDVARLVGDVFATALAEDPKARFESGVAFAEALGAAARGEGGRKPKVRRRKTAPLGAPAAAAAAAVVSEPFESVEPPAAVVEIEPEVPAPTPAQAEPPVVEPTRTEAVAPETVAAPTSAADVAEAETERAHPAIEDQLRPSAETVAEPHPGTPAAAPIAAAQASPDDARVEEDTVAKPTDRDDRPEPDDWTDDDREEPPADRTWLFDDEEAVRESDEPEPASVGRRSAIPISRPAASDLRARGSMEMLDDRDEDETRDETPVDDDSDSLGDVQADRGADYRYDTAAPPFMLPAEDDGRRGHSALPLALLMLAVGLLTGFAGGYLFAKRSAPAATEVAAETRPPVNPSGKEWSDTAVADSRAPSPKPSAVAPPVPSGELAAPAANAPTIPRTAPPAAAKTPVKPPSRVRGALTVRTTPSGVAVNVNGRVRGSTPFEMLDLPFGRYTIVLRHDGYQPETRQVSIGAADPTASIDVRLRPAPSKKGTAPAPASKSAAPPKAPPATPKAPPAAAGAPPAESGPGSLEIDSRPRGASVTVDGRRVGTTPVTLASIAAGEHQVQLALAGHQPWTSSVTVEPGKKARVAGSLEPK